MPKKKTSPEEGEKKKGGRPPKRVNRRNKYKGKYRDATCANRLRKLKRLVKSCGLEEAERVVKTTPGGTSKNKGKNIPEYSRPRMSLQMLRFLTGAK